ncbi:inorganic diphosphatase [Pseudozobellia sp. WGM2]|uniref:inorganic diphosphatase n=1 Tax=Pseudozobellia sp. WGM2 TaxID=2787625 RepID=UPI001AE07B65|nr:inorganic diphosphatase [Pseudozobellia sp. WGM2]
MIVTKKAFYIPITICIVLLHACKSAISYYSLPTFVNEGTVNCVVEIAAGTNKKYEYNPTLNTFVIDQENSQNRIIDFLPYPANYGFIPSTISKEDGGGDGDALDVLVISEALATGTAIESIPIAVLKLIDDGEIDYKVIAVPANKKARVINAISFEEMLSTYPNLLKILELWFLNYNKNDVSLVEGWGNEKEAAQEIKRHLKTR